MSTFSDRIKQAAQASKTATLPTTGATAALSKQAQVSSTGKAAPTGASAQSNIAEASTVSQAQTQLAGVAQEGQAAATDMALKEGSEALKQEQFDAQQRMQKLEADNQFNNRIKELTSRVEMSKDKKQQDLDIMEMKSALATQRLGNARYKQALEEAGRNQRLVSRQDFAARMSDISLDRGKISADDQNRISVLRADYERDTQGQVDMQQISTALEKYKQEQARAKTEMIVGAATTAAGAGIDAYNAPDKKET